MRPQEKILGILTPTYQFSFNPRTPRVCLLGICEVCLAWMLDFWDSWVFLLKGIDEQEWHKWAFLRSPFSKIINSSQVPTSTWFLFFWKHPKTRWCLSPLWMQLLTFLKQKTTFVLSNQLHGKQSTRALLLCRKCHLPQVFTFSLAVSVSECNFWYNHNVNKQLTAK